MNLYKLKYAVLHVAPLQHECVARPEVMQIT